MPNRNSVSQGKCFQSRNTGLHNLETHISLFSNFCICMSSFGSVITLTDFPFDVVSAWFYQVLYIRDGDLSQGVSYGHVLDDCYYSRDTVGIGILCSAWRRRIDTSTACDCRDCNSISTVDWKTYLDWRQKIVRMLIQVG